MTNTVILKCAKCERPILDPENVPDDDSALCAVCADPDGTVSVALAAYLNLVLNQVVDLDECIALEESVRDGWMDIGRVKAAARACDRIDLYCAERDVLVRWFRHARQAGIDELAES